MKFPRAVNTYSNLYLLIKTKILLLAPQVPPWNVTGYNTSSTSIYVHWIPIPPARVAGVLRLYRVLYDEQSSVGQVVKAHTLELPKSNLSIKLGGLRKYTNYTVEVQGVTKYYGERSNSILITTDEDSK